MKRSNLYLSGLTVLGILITFIYFFPWPNERKITCKIREKIGDIGALTSVHPIDTGSIDLQIHNNHSDKKTFNSEVVKNIKVQIEVSHGSLNIFKLFGTQFVIPAWTILQTFEDLKTGAKSSILNFTPKVLSDFRNAEWANFERSNGDFVGTECSLSSLDHL